MKYFYHNEKLCLKFFLSFSNINIFFCVLFCSFPIKLPPAKYFHKNVSYTLPYDYKALNRSTVNECTTTWPQKTYNLVKLYVLKNSTIVMTSQDVINFCWCKYKYTIFSNVFRAIICFHKDRFFFVRTIVFIWV